MREDERGERERGREKRQRGRESRGREIFRKVLGNFQQRKFGTLARE